MRIVFMGKCKRSAARALDWLVAEGVEVVAVVAQEPGPLTVSSQRLDLVAERRGIPLVSDDDLYANPPDADLVISFLFWKRIRQPLIGIGCLNFHPAPLPDYRGLGGFNVAILDGLSEWGVSCHWVDEEFDTGDLVDVDRFPIAPDTETALSLDIHSQERLLAQLQRVVGKLLRGEELPRTPQGDGRYVTAAEFEELRVVRPGDDVARKVRAFWYPPWPGAVIEVDGKRYTLADDARLLEVARANAAAGRVA